MRRLVLGALLVVTGAAHADCDLYGQAARVSMSARQDGVPLVRMVSVSPPGSPTHQILLGAYDEPLWPSAPYKERAINEYESRVYLACLRAN